MIHHQTVLKKKSGVSFPVQNHSKIKIIFWHNAKEKEPY